MSATVRRIDTDGELDTNDNLFHNMAAIFTNLNSAGQFIANVVCRRNTDGASQGWQVGCQYKNVNGVVTTTFTKTFTFGTNADKSALNTTDINLVADSDNIMIQVKGLSLTSIQWAGLMSGAEVYNI